MKRYLLYGSLVLSVLFTACGKEVKLSPSGNDNTNWFVIADNPSNAADHAIYQFYTATGIPVFYKDTIGSEKRLNVFGQTYTFYEKLQVTYNPDGGNGQTVSPTVYYETLTNKTVNAVLAINFLNTQIIASLPTKFISNIRSVLLVDTLSSTFGHYAYAGYNTIVLGSVPRISSMSAATLKSYKAATYRAICQKAVFGNASVSAWLTSNFYSISRSVKTNVPTWVPDIYAGAAFNIYTLTQPYTYYGFIGVDPTVTYQNQTPPTTTDAAQYAEAIFTYTTAEFTALYGTYPLVMQKYNLMKNLLISFGFTFN